MLFCSIIGFSGFILCPGLPEDLRYYWSVAMYISVRTSWLT